MKAGPISKTSQVSVIVPVFNASSTLHKFLKSIQKQDYPKLEVIFVDDGSSDNSPEIIRSYGYEPVISPANQGQSMARNLGLAKAAGELVCFFDSDVVLKADTVSSLVLSLREHEGDAVSGNYEYEPADTNIFSRFYSYLKSYNHGECVVKGHNILGTYCCIVCKSYLDAAGGFGNFPPGMDIECEAVGRNLSLLGCRFIFDPSIRVWHHFGGFRKILYVFSNRVYWYARYRVLIPSGKEPVKMRGISTAAAVGGYTSFAVTSMGYLAAAAVSSPTGYLSVLLLTMSMLGLSLGIAIMARFYLYCLRKGGMAFSLTCFVITPFFFMVAGFSGLAGTLVSLIKMQRQEKDRLSGLLRL